MVGGGSNALADGVAVAKELLKENKSNGEALRRCKEPIRERSIPQAQKSKSKTNTAWIHSGWFGGYTAQVLFFILSSVL
jgi:hypothetical protein